MFRKQYCYSSKKYLQCSLLLNLDFKIVVSFVFIYYNKYYKVLQIVQYQLGNV